MTCFNPIKTLGLALCLSLASPFGLTAQEKKAEENSGRAEKPRAEKPENPPPGRGEAKPERGERKSPAPPKRQEVEKKQEQSKQEKRTWIGVAMAPVPSALREHLDLAEGFGVQVAQVIDDSPADKAGLREHDILTKLNDQILTTPEHLQLLVRSMEIGDKVDVTFIRKGAEESVSLALGESTIPLQSWSHPQSRGDDHYRGGDRYSRPPQGEHWDQIAREHQDRLQKMMEENRNRNAPSRPDMERKGSAPVRPPAVSVRPGFPVQVVGANGMIRIDNAKGEVTIVIKDGSHEMTIKDDDGRQIYKGPYKAGEKDGGLPEKARNYLKEMKLEDLDVLLPTEDEEKPEKVGGSNPEEEKNKPGKKDEIL